MKSALSSGLKGLPSLSHDRCCRCLGLVYCGAQSACYRCKITVDEAPNVLVTENVLKEIISKFVAIKKLGRTAEKPEVEYVPVDLDEQMVRTILLGQDPRTGVPLKGGGLASRLPKA